MARIKKICGRSFKFIPFGEDGCEHDSGIYKYQNRDIVMEWTDVGFEDRWGNYRETTVRRWVIIGITPYYQFNFTSITMAADHIDAKHLGW